MHGTDFYPDLISLSLENFRIFSKPYSFKFAPITILTGANNSGKSSVLKALLLLAENAEKNNLNKIEFDGQKNVQHKLGSFNQVINKNAKKKILSFNYSYFFQRKATQDAYFGNEQNHFSITLDYINNQKENHTQLKKLEIFDKKDNLIFHINLDYKYCFDINIEWFVKEFKKINFHPDFDAIGINSIFNGQSKPYSFNKFLLPSSVIKKDILEKKLINFDKEGVKNFITYLEKHVYFLIGSGEFKNELVTAFKEHHLYSGVGWINEVHPRVTGMVTN